MKLYPYCIQCTDQNSGDVGDFAYDPSDCPAAGQFKAITPVFDDLAEFYDWCRANNFGIHHGRGAVVTKQR
jgi:hypothetical protein